MRIAILIEVDRTKGHPLVLLERENSSMSNVAHLSMEYYLQRATVRERGARIGQTWTETFICMRCTLTF
jgi:hypothetical protein